MCENIKANNKIIRTTAKFVVLTIIAIFIFSLAACGERIADNCDGTAYAIPQNTEGEAPQQEQSNNLPYIGDTMDGDIDGQNNTTEEPQNDTINQQNADDEQINTTEEEPAVTDNQTPNEEQPVNANNQQDTTPVSPATVEEPQNNTSNQQNTAPTAPENPTAVEMPQRVADWGVTLTIIRYTDGQARFSVTGINTGGAGYASGLVMGDVFISVNDNNIPLNDITIGMEMPFIPNAELGNSFTLRVSRNGELVNVQMRIG